MGIGGGSVSRRSYRWNVDEEKLLGYYGEMVLGGVLEIILARLIPLISGFQSVNLRYLVLYEN